jgi:hypothetical protein
MACSGATVVDAAVHFGCHGARASVVQRCPRLVTSGKRIRVLRYSSQPALKGPARVDAAWNPAMCVRPRRL